MPRALPWATGGSAKIEKSAVKKTKPKPQREPHPAADDDLVYSDLDAVHSKSPEGKKPEKKRMRASSSSPPPPGPPPVEVMKPGFAADDIYMMVEDEFYSTALLYTGHIHHAEYQRLRKLHRSRGQETLAGLGRGTDGKTEQSKALRMKMESLELAKKQKQTVRKLRGEAGEGSGAEGSEAEDEYMQDPHLSGLMRESQMAPVQDLKGLVNTKANTRAAAGYLQSPYRAERTRDAFAEEKQWRTMSRVSEHEDEPDDRGSPSGARGKPKGSTNPAVDEDSVTDDDDLDAGVPSDSGRTISAWADKVVAPAVMPQAVAKVGVSQLAEKRLASETANHFRKTCPPKREIPVEQVEESSLASAKQEVLPSPRSTRPTSLPTPPRESNSIARKRAERAAAEKQRKTVKKDLDDIPTFLY